MNGKTRASRAAGPKDGRLVWDDRCGAPPRRLRLLARTEESSVWRVLGRLGGKRAFILKQSRDTRAVVHELSAHAQVVGRLKLATSPVIAGGVNDHAPGGYIAFADDRLRAARPRRVEDMARLLAALHRTPLDGLHVPDSSRSHTPEVRRVTQFVLDIAPEECARWLTPFVSKKEDRRALVAVLENLQRTHEPVWRETPVVLCHGDAHAANFLSTLRGGRLRLIDWEYVHLDYPYFDLFQLLDATSPHTPLPVFASRLRALSAYHAAAMGETSGRNGKPSGGEGRLPSWGRFAQSYLRYALIHLFWILSRIDDDGRFSRHSAPRLNRQAHETCRLIRSIVDDWRVVAGEPF